ncbi:cytochrome c maturation protein CcmE domain-containing protein [Flavilitoribacter nigricans]|uniref:Cytochrome C biogenesis protein n=1 Tax=Flavilitoribacter nigricans (strain ATCC 23147 / DSM 23189 / NBRC 102662 / NCIMB 1420 / SS-2) TaxID=1122177 RepID=A0A2D0ND08_FLAN2|nr:cytochrome c maturation protein CcmE [Flavilitoribacter nigricans]PHN06375.1 cytochrome C biogenesis protein [Flavilitoribacter nigricans DSM 23189 = NBRC 102662]
MKKVHFIGIAMIGIAIFLLSQVAGDMSTYATFHDADQAGEKVKIAGQLAKDKEIVYNPEKDPNYTSFYMRDSEGEERKIVLLAAKPQDFELSEQLVLTGSMDGDTFVATDMLTKCPSKYKDEEIYIKSEKKG